MLNSLDGVQKELKEYKKKYEEEHANVVKLLKCHEDIVQVIEPYLISAFTGINEAGCFDLTLAIKEIMESHESAYVSLEDRHGKLLDKYNKLLDKLQNVSNYNY